MKMIHSARWGCGFTWVDVTSRISEILTAGTTAIASPQDLQCDPSPGNPKLLVVLFNTGQEFIIPELHEFSLDKMGMSGHTMTQTATIPKRIKHRLAFLLREIEDRISGHRGNQEPDLSCLIHDAAALAADLQLKQPIGIDVHGTPPNRIDSYRLNDPLTSDAEIVLTFRRSIDDAGPASPFEVVQKFTKRSKALFDRWQRALLQEEYQPEATMKTKQRAHHKKRQRRIRRKNAAIKNESQPTVSNVPERQIQNAILPPLTDTERAVLEIIKKQYSGEGIQGKDIVKQMRGLIEVSTLTRHIIPKLKTHGVKNRRGAGYYIST